MSMFNALLHHLGRAVDQKGRTVFADPDCRAETVAEVEALEHRISELERALEAVVERIDQPDWRERR
jgi:hypothetical protein